MQLRHIDIANLTILTANMRGRRKADIANCLAGNNGRAKVERIVPRSMTFPPSAHTMRGGVQTISRAEAVEDLFAPTTDADRPSDGVEEPDGEAGAASEPQPVAEAA